MRTTLISLRVTPSELKAIDELSGTMGYRSRSHVLIDAINNHFAALRLSGPLLDRMRAERLKMRERVHFLQRSRKCQGDKKCRSRGTARA